MTFLFFKNALIKDKMLMHGYIFNQKIFIFNWRLVASITNSIGLSVGPSVFKKFWSEPNFKNKHTVVAYGTTLSRACFKTIFLFTIGNLAFPPYFSCNISLTWEKKFVITFISFLYKTRNSFEIHWQCIGDLGQNYAMIKLEITIQNWVQQAVA